MLTRSQVISAATKMVVALLCLQSANVVWAQAAVRDSTPASSVSSPPAQVASDVSTRSASSDLFYKLESMQQELMQLRGQVEEQAFEIKRLKQQRLDDYLDLDKRLSELSKNSASPVNSPAVTQVGSLTGDAEPDESALYNEAINRLLDEQDYAGAQAGFSQYLEAYPEGAYTANVYYWQGQIHLTEGETEQAEAAFLKIINQYPQHQKTPDAQLKLAKIYFDKGNKTEAKALLDELAQADSDVARLAKTFLENNF